MKKEYRSFQEITSLPIISSLGETSIVYRDKNMAIKLYNHDQLVLEKAIEFSTEDKILNAKQISELPELNIPVSAVYDKKTGKFIASKSNYIEGSCYGRTYFGDCDDLSKICKFHSKAEDFLARADKNNIVLTDYGSDDNIIIDIDGNLHFIDYDGIQIGNYQSLSLSTILPQTLIFTPKYCRDSINFTQELNILSYYMLFFLDAMNADLNCVEKYYNGDIFSLDDFFNYTGLDDADIQHKVWKLFNPTERNEYLGNDLIRLQEIYDIKIIARDDDYTFKKLVRK